MGLSTKSFTEDIQMGSDLGLRPRAPTSGSDLRLQEPLQAPSQELLNLVPHFLETRGLAPGQLSDRWGHVGPGVVSSPSPTACHHKHFKRPTCVQGQRFRHDIALP